MESIIAFVITFGILGGLFFIWSKLTDRILEKREKKYTKKKYIDIFTQSCTNQTLKQEIQKYRNSEFNQKPTNLFITKNFIITKKLKVIELKNVLWAYKFIRTVVSKGTGNKMGSATKICFLLDNGKKLGFYQDGEFLVDEILKEIQKNASWIILGYTKELEKDISHNFQKYVDLKNQKL